MGIVSFSLSTRMKLLCVVALVAGVRAEAEADPQLLYSGIYPGVYSHAIHAPVVKSVEAKPAEAKAPAVEAERKKREAEPVAEAVADAAPDAEAATRGSGAPVESWRRPSVSTRVRSLL